VTLRTIISRLGLVVVGAVVLVGCEALSAFPTASVSPTVGTTTAPVDAYSGLLWLDLTDLPPEAASTLALIESNGPFPYDQDGAVFQNREGILPDEATGYYREYTVQTPGSPDRGARRIVAGSDGELYWTDDHYDSFSRIRT
jgi:ribonuclease T1